MRPRHAASVLALALALLPSRAPAAGPHLDAQGDALAAAVRLRLGTVRFRHGGFVSRVAFSPNGRLLATQASDNWVHLWDVKTGKELHRLRGMNVHPLAFSPDGKLLASAGGFWDVTAGHWVRKYPVTGTPSALAFAPDGKHLALGGYEKWLILIDWHTGREVRRFAGPFERPTSLAFTRDSRTLAAADGNGTVRLWEVATGKERRRFIHPGWVGALALSPDDRTLVSSSWSRTLYVWDVKTGKELRRLESPNDEAFSIAFTHDGKHVACGLHSSPVIGLWDVATGKRVRQLGQQSLGRTTSSSFCASIAISPDGKTLAGRGQNDAVVILWDVASGRELHSFAAHDTGVDLLAVSADGKTLASASHANGSLHVWDLSTGARLRTLPGHAGGVAALAFAPNGKTLAAAAIQDESIRLWDATTGKRLHHLPLPDRVANPQRSIGSLYYKDVAVAFAPDGKVLATGTSDGKVHLWELPSAKHRRTFQALPIHVDGDGERYMHAVSRLVFSPDGEGLAVGSLSEDTFYLYTAAGDRLLRRFRPKPPATPSSVGYRFWDMALVFSPDGKSQAAAGGCLDESVRLWEVATGQERRQLGGPQRPLHMAAFSPDGRTLASWRRDGGIRLWEVAGGREVADLRGHRGEVLSVAFLPDGRVVSGGADTTILVWDKVPARKAATRGR
jgi:WD40 repeat protein